MTHGLSLSSVVGLIKVSRQPGVFLGNLVLQSAQDSLLVFFRTMATKNSNESDQLAYVSRRKVSKFSHHLNSK